jgi:putative colanic acid biosynthesis acetyltransferase WcaF
LLRVIPLREAGSPGFDRGRKLPVFVFWLFVQELLVYNPIQLSSRIRATCLRCFGAKIGDGVVMRPRLRVRHPWKLEVGDGCWIGEGVWIDNHGHVKIGHDVVLSQEAYLSTGSHALGSNMDLKIADIEIEAGAWIAARSIVLLGSRLSTNTVLMPGSVFKGISKPGWFYAGNPAVPIKERIDSRIEA